MLMISGMCWRGWVFPTHAGRAFRAQRLWMRDHARAFTKIRSGSGESHCLRADGEHLPDFRSEWVKVECVESPWKMASGSRFCCPDTRLHAGQAGRSIRKHPVPRSYRPFSSDHCPSCFAVTICPWNHAFAVAVPLRSWLIYDQDHRSQKKR